MEVAERDLTLLWSAHICGSDDASPIKHAVSVEAPAVAADMREIGNDGEDHGGDATAKATEVVIVVSSADHDKRVAGVRVSAANTAPDCAADE